jgi:hypothetical protein
VLDALRPLLEARSRGGSSAHERNGVPVVEISDR